MSLFRKLRVLFICYDLAGFTGVLAWLKFGTLLKQHVKTISESSVFQVGGTDA